MKDIKGVRYEDIIKDMTEEELERFHKERYEKFIKPLMGMNLKEVEKLEKGKKDQYNQEDMPNYGKMFVEYVGKIRRRYIVASTHRFNIFYK